MLYSPLDHDDDDDFSHLPTVDGALSSPPSVSRQKAAPPVEESAWEPEPEWNIQDESATPPASDWPEVTPPPEDTLFSDPLSHDIAALDGGGYKPPLLDGGEAAGFSEDDFLDDDLPEGDPPGDDTADLPRSVNPSAGAPVVVSADTADDLETPADNTGDIIDAKKRALIWTAGAHLLLLFLLAVIQVAPVSQPLNEIVAISSDVLDQQEPAWKKIAPAAPAPAGGPSMMAPIVATGSSQIAMPDVDFSPTASELNVGSSLGSFGAGGSGSAGGSVSFLGNQGKGSHVVFVVDVSGSMSAVGEVGGKAVSRFDLLKQELIRSLNQLRGNVHYQVIYFSHFAWPHNEIDSTDSRALARYEWDISPGQRNAKIPRFRYLPANPANIAKSRKIIEDSDNPGGTNWGSGLLMALNGSPKPDLIFFMTDGNRSDALTWVDEVTAANARGDKRAIIHTTAMMTPDAAKELDELARLNGGKFTVVQADGTIVKSADFFKVAVE